MKINRLLLLLFVLLVSFGFLFAQENAIANGLNNNKKVFIEGKEKTNKERVIKFTKGWSVGMNFGVTKFQGDISQYDYYPSYQETGDFSELRTAASLVLEKRMNSLYSLGVEVVTGRFAGLRRPNEYLIYDVFDSYQNYEGNGDKFIASFTETDLFANINLTNLMSYFTNNKRDFNIDFNAKLGLGCSVFNTVRRNLYSDTYIYSFGYSDEGVNTSSSDYGNVKNSFFSQTKSRVSIYGISATYKLNNKMNLNFDYTVRNSPDDNWDASIMNTQYKTDKFAFLSLGLSYKLAGDDFNTDWVSPIDFLKNDISIIKVNIEGFTDDSDYDGVVDAFDQSPNTPLGVSVDGSGSPLDVDMDNVPDYIDADPFSNRGAVVNHNGVEFDDDQDGVPNSRDLESNTPSGKIVNQFGITLKDDASSNNIALAIYFPSIYFSSGSAIVEKANENRIATMALLLKNNPEIKLNVIGNTDNVGDRKFNKELALKRADAVINYLVLNYNLSRKRFFAKSKGEEDPLAIISGYESNINLISSVNRRVDFELIE